MQEAEKNRNKLNVALKQLAKAQVWLPLRLERWLQLPVCMPVVHGMACSGKPCILTNTLSQDDVDAFRALVEKLEGMDGLPPAALEALMLAAERFGMAGWGDVPTAHAATTVRVCVALHHWGWLVPLQLWCRGLTALIEMAQTRLLSLTQVISDARNSLCSAACTEAEPPCGGTVPGQ